MARLARVVVPGVAHHVTQRGNRRQPTFFQEDDYRAYLELLGEGCGRCGVEVWAYCLMPNHVHLIVVPQSEDGLRRALGEAHRRYTRRINFREGWRGHLWQGRFASFALDARYLRRAARYVELNPVRAKLCRMPWRWPWSSAAAHVAGKEDGVVRVAPLRAREGLAGVSAGTSGGSGRGIVASARAYRTPSGRAGVSGSGRASPRADRATGPARTQAKADGEIGMVSRMAVR
jgi:putative transposase